METPEGILGQPRSERQVLRGSIEEIAGLASFKHRVRAFWSEIRAIDLPALSRYQVESTRGFLLPDQPSALKGRAIGRDEESGRVYLELKGPRLPARYDIVYRHLTFYAGFDPATQELGTIVVTIRTQVLE